MYHIKEILINMYMCAKCKTKLIDIITAVLSRTKFRLEVVVISINTAVKVRIKVWKLTKYSL